MSAKKRKRLSKSRPQPKKRTPRPKARSPKAAGKDKRKGLRGAKKRAETLRRKRISKALKAYNKKKKAAKTFIEGDTKADRKWGEKLAKEAKKARREMRRKPPKVKSKVHVPATLPEGFTDIAADKLSRIEYMMQNAVAILTGETTSPMREEFLGRDMSLDAIARAHTNADGSFDAELMVRGIPRGVKMRDLSIFIENLISVVPGTFISVGFRTSRNEEFSKENYNRVRGKTQIQTHFHRTTKKAIAFVHARKIDSTLIDHRYHKAEDFFVRIHWNQEGTKPARKR